MYSCKRRISRNRDGAVTACEEEVLWGMGVVECTLVCLKGLNMRLPCRRSGLYRDWDQSVIL